jgi:hypothetical protein
LKSPVFWQRGAASAAPAIKLAPSRPAAKVSDAFRIG